MRQLGLSAVWSAVLTFGAAAALRADNAVLAVLAMAALSALFAWLAAQQSNEEASGLALTGPAAALSMTLGGRSPISRLLPLVAAQVVGAVLGGLAALALEDQLGLSLGWTSPTLIGIAVVGLVIGLVSGWLIAFIDGYLNEGLAAVPVLIAGGLAPVGYALAANPAVLVGLAAAGLLMWSTSLALIAGLLVGTAIAGFSLPAVASPETV